MVCQLWLVVFTFIPSSVLNRLERKSFMHHTFIEKNKEAFLLFCGGLR